LVIKELSLAGEDELDGAIIFKDVKIRPLNTRLRSLCLTQFTLKSHSTQAF
jgi:hypothetical protein